MIFICKNYNISWLLYLIQVNMVIYKLFPILFNFLNIKSLFVRFSLFVPFLNFILFYKILFKNNDNYETL